MSLSFKKAVKLEKSLKLALIGASGSGKTYSGLVLGARIAELRGGSLAVIDTERGSASLYADQFEFDVLEMEPPYTSEKFIRAVNIAKHEGYKCLLVDSLSHYWAGSGGILEEVDKAMRGYGGNKYYAWADGTPKHNAIVDAMIGTNMDVIATMRTKSAYVEVEEQGRKGYVKAGTTPIQRDGIDVEFDLVIGLSADHVGTVDKGRFPEIDGEFWDPLTADLADTLIDLLKGIRPEQPALEDVKTKSDLVRYLASDEIITDFVDPANMGTFVDHVTGGTFDPRMVGWLFTATRDYVYNLSQGGVKKDLARELVTTYHEALVALDMDEVEDEDE